jgi:hypothetical protein
VGDLSADRREKLPARDFGLPEKARTADDKRESGNYPMPDKAHARNAKARASQQYKAGNLTKAERDRIHRKADKILGKKTKAKKGKKAGAKKKAKKPGKR